MLPGQILHLEPGRPHLHAECHDLVAAGHSTASVIGQDDDRHAFEFRVEHPLAGDIEVVAVDQRDLAVIGAAAPTAAWDSNPSTGDTPGLGFGLSPGVALLILGRLLPGVLPIPPCQASSQLVQIGINGLRTVAATGRCNPDLANGAAVLVALVPFDADVFAEDQSRQMLFRSLTEGLLFLRGVNARQADLDLAVVAIEHGDRVAVRDLDHPTVNLVGHGRRAEQCLLNSTQICPT